MSDQKLTTLGLQAEAHWREYLPKLFADLKAKGELKDALLKAQKATEEEMNLIYGQLRKQDLTEDQARRQAWEMVREKYILLPPEEDDWSDVER